MLPTQGQNRGLQALKDCLLTGKCESLFHQAAQKIYQNIYSILAQPPKQNGFVYESAALVDTK